MPASSRSIRLRCQCSCASMSFVCPQNKSMLLICRKLKPSVRRRPCHDNSASNATGTRSTAAKAVGEMQQPQASPSEMSRASTMPLFLPELAAVNHHQHQSQQQQTQQQPSQHASQPCGDVLDALLASDTAMSRMSTDSNHSTNSTSLLQFQAPSTASSGYLASGRPPRRPSASRLSRGSRGSDDYVTLPPSISPQFSAPMPLGDMEAGALPRITLDEPPDSSPLTWQGAGAVARTPLEDVTLAPPWQSLFARGENPGLDSPPSSSLLPGLPWASRPFQPDSARPPAAGLNFFRPSRLSTVSSDNETNSLPTIPSAAGSDQTLDQSIASIRILTHLPAEHNQRTSTEIARRTSAENARRPSAEAPRRVSDPTSSRAFEPLPPTDEVALSGHSTPHLADVATTLSSDLEFPISGCECLCDLGSRDIIDSNEASMRDPIWGRVIPHAAVIVQASTANVVLSPAQAVDPEQSSAVRPGRTHTEPIPCTDVWQPVPPAAMLSIPRPSTTPTPSYIAAAEAATSLAQQAREDSPGNQMQLPGIQSMVSAFRREPTKRMRDMRSPFARPLPPLDPAPMTAEPDKRQDHAFSSSPQARSRPPRSSSGNSSQPQAESDGGTLESQITLTRAFSAAGPQSIPFRGLNRALGQTFPPLPVQLSTPFAQASSSPDISSSSSILHANDNTSSTQQPNNFERSSSILTENSERLPDSHCGSSSRTPSNAGASSFSELVQEIAVMKKLAHPNIVKLHEVYLPVVVIVLAACMPSMLPASARCSKC